MTSVDSQSDGHATSISASLLIREELEEPGTLLFGRQVSFHVTSNHGLGLSRFVSR